jgi:hypothetical protein
MTLATQPHSGNDEGSRIRGMIKAAIKFLFNLAVFLHTGGLANES